MTKIHISIPIDLRNQYKAVCASMGSSMDSITRELIRVFLSENSKEG